MTQAGSGNRVRSVTGIVLVDKPAGLSSNRVLQKTKRLFGARKAGHTGTLDAPATGMLPVCLGVATRLSALLLDASKHYRVTAVFGTATDTGDATGAVLENRDPGLVERNRVEAALVRFRGTIEQVPPMYSALKQGGRRLHELARQGIEVAREPRSIRIHELEIESMDWPRLTFRVHCSKGTYIRSLVTDVASELQTLGHVASLRRLAVGPFQESQMVDLAVLERAAEAGPEALSGWLLPADTALTAYPSVRISEAEALALRQGRFVTVDNTVEGAVRVYEANEGFIGLGRLSGSGLLKPFRIFPA